MADTLRKMGYDLVSHYQLLDNYGDTMAANHLRVVKLKNVSLNKFLLLPRRSERLRKKRKRIDTLANNKRRKLNSGLIGK